MWRFTNSKLPGILLTGYLYAAGRVAPPPPSAISLLCCNLCSVPSAPGKRKMQTSACSWQSQSSVRSQLEHYREKESSFLHLCPGEGTGDMTAVSWWCNSPDQSSSSLCNGSPLKGIQIRSNSLSCFFFFIILMRNQAGDMKDWIRLGWEDSRSCGSHDHRPARDSCFSTPTSCHLAGMWKICFFIRSCGCETFWVFHIGR